MDDNTGALRCSNPVGRPKSADPLIFKTVGLTEKQWEWLALWMPTGNRTARLQEVLERAMKFWPGGPHLFGHEIRRRKKRSPA